MQKHTFQWMGEIYMGEISNVPLEILQISPTPWKLCILFKSEELRDLGFKSLQAI